jgi:hypothetical protein
MRTMLRVILDTDAGNQAIMDGTLPQIIADLSETIKPEASYFFPDGGYRSCIMIFDLKDVSDIPMIGEPLYMKLGATIEFIPVMNAEDLTQGMGKMMAKMK